MFSLLLKINFTYYLIISILQSKKINIIHIIHIIHAAEYLKILQLGALQVASATS